MWMLKQCSLVGALAVATSVACGGDGGSGPSAALVGTWDATSTVFTSVADPSTQVDIIQLGATTTVDLTASHAFTVTVSLPGQADEVSTGTWSSSPDVLTLTFATGMTGTMQFDMTLSGDNLTLSGADAEFDFNADGTDDPAKLSLTLVRQ